MDRANGKDRLKTVPSSARGRGVRIGGGEATMPAARAAALQPALADQPLVADEGGLGLSGKVPALAAERPDAAQRPWYLALRAVAHAVVLLSVVGFVFIYCVWSPLAGRLRGGAQAATVVVVAEGAAEVRAPEVSGVFRADRPLASGQAVRKGQLLGRIESPTLEAELERAAAELAALQVQQLRLEQRVRWGGDAAPAGSELVSLEARVATAAAELERFDRVRQRLVIRAPADGNVQQGLPATADVTAGARLCLIVPRGAKTHVEVTAPREVLNELQRRGMVVADFAAPHGTLKSPAVPVSASVRPFLKAAAGGRDEIWGVLQCTPLPSAEAAVVPGTIGRLCW